MHSAGPEPGAAPARAGDLPIPWRLPLLLLAIASLVAGLGSGLARLGWAPSFGFASLVPAHGPLMVCGFLGTLIGLERAVAYGRRRAYAGPLLTGLGALLLLTTGLQTPAAALQTGGSVVLLLLALHFHRLQPNLANLTVAAGAGSWLAGNLAWLAGVPLPGVVPWWIAFLVLTIAGERLELSRYLPVPERARTLFRAALLLLLAGVAAHHVDARIGAALTGVALLLLLAWLLRYDIARRTVRMHGVARYAAVAILNGYAWLAVAALAWLVEIAVPASGRDTLLHAIFLGFVFSMVFAHAPIILPAVSGARMPFSRVFYLPLLILDGSLLLRFAGNLVPLQELRIAGGIGHLAAIVLFVGCVAGSVIVGRRGVTGRAAP
jgi:hypothetical protein